MAERSNKQITVSLSWDTYREIDRQREGTKLTRSAWVEKAVRAYLAEVDEAEKERRDGLGEKIEEVLELVKHQGDRISEQNDRLSGEARQHADEVIGTIRRDRRATERVYALVEGVHFPPEQREEAHEAADEQASKRLRVEEQRKREREARWRAGEEKASDGGEEAGPVEGSG